MARDDGAAMPDPFSAAIARIMAIDVEVERSLHDRPDRPDSYGWLRRPEYDGRGGEAWELPDGAIRLTRSRAPQITPPRDLQPRRGRRER